jgi:hypothetical protein
MDRNGIDQCWLLTWEETNCLAPVYMHLSVKDVFEAYERYPTRILPMYAPDPNSPDATTSLKAWYEKGIRGCGELKASLNWDSAKLGSLLSCVSQLEIPLIFHMEDRREFFTSSSGSSFECLLARAFMTERLFGLPRKALETIAAVYRPLKEKKKSMYRLFPGYLLDFTSLEARLREYPGINFIGHGPLFWKGISLDSGSETSVYPNGPVVGEGIICRLLSQYENLYADTSGPSAMNALTRDPRLARNFLSKYKHKILFGTDNFSIGIKEFLDSLKLSKRTYQLIYGDNATKLIK